MQEKNAPNSSFLHRSNYLAQKLKCSVKSLSKVTGLSERTILGARNSAKISAKTWRKLEAAEREAGISIRQYSHPLLTDISVEEQPSDYQISALRREADTPKSRTWRATLKQAATLAAGLFPNDKGRREVFLDLFIDLKSELDELQDRCERLEEDQVEKVNLGRAGKGGARGKSIEEPAPPKTFGPDDNIDGDYSEAASKERVRRARQFSQSPAADDKEREEAG
jgi:hypothetical protein